MAYSGAICFTMAQNYQSHPRPQPPSAPHRSSFQPWPHPWTNWMCGLSAPPTISRSCSKNTRCRATSSIDFHPNHHDHVHGAAGSTLMVGSPAPQCHQSMVVGSPPPAPPLSQSSGLGLLGPAAALVGASRSPGQRPQFRQA